MVLIYSSRIWNHLGPSSTFSAPLEIHRPSLIKKLITSFTSLFVSSRRHPQWTIFRDFDALRRVDTLPVPACCRISFAWSQSILLLGLRMRSVLVGCRPSSYVCCLMICFLRFDSFVANTLLRRFTNSADTRTLFKLVALSTLLCFFTLATLYASTWFTLPLRRSWSIRQIHTITTPSNSNWCNTTKVPR